MTIKIGILDSGKGGLTILEALKKQLPDATFSYFADTKNFPYGTKSKEEIIQCCITAIDPLITQVQCIVVACHTASVNALDTLQKRYSLPIIGMIEPLLHAVKEHKHANTLTLLATEATLKTNLYQNALHKLFPYAEITSLSCPLLIEQIEKKGHPNEAFIREQLAPLFSQPPDLLILASTHYGHIADDLAKLLLTTTIIDPADAVASLLTSMA